MRRSDTLGSAGQGVVTAVAYGQPVLVASLPGGGVFVVGCISREPQVSHPGVPAQSRVPALRQGGRRG